MKTRQQIEAQIRMDNPTSDGLSAGHPKYEALISKWVDSYMETRSPFVPQSVTPRQFRIALLRSGIKPKDIDASLSSNEEALIEWQFAQEVKRDHPLVLGMAAQLGKSQSELDAIFTLAATI